MTPRASTLGQRSVLRAGTIHVHWHNPPTSPRVTLTRVVRGRTLQREVGPRGRLTLAEAAAVLHRAPADVRRAISTGFLAARRVDGIVVTTPGACCRYIEEVKRDLVEARAARGEPHVPAALVHARRA